MHITAVMLLLCIKVLREGFFCFHGRDWEGVCRKLLSLVKLLDMKYRSKFKHGFTNRGCLHSAILKALRGFQKKKEPTGQGVCNFFIKIFQMRFSRFSKCLKTT